MSPSPGAPRRTGAGHVDSYGQGRVCSRQGCTTQLSRYNANAVCAEHSVREGADTRQPAVRRPGS